MKFLQTHGQATNNAVLKFYSVTYVRSGLTPLAMTAYQHLIKRGSHKLTEDLYLPLTIPRRH